MASVDGARSLQGASDELYDITCGPCQTDKLDKKANHYCNECREYLCDSCKDVHQKLAITKSHSILSGEKRPAPSSSYQKYGVPVYCGCNKNQEVEFYCEEHQDLMCNPCKKLKHRHCKINDVQDKISKCNTEMLNEVLTKIKSLEHRYESMQKQCKSELKGLKGIIEDCKKEIKDFRAKIDAFLDRLEQNMIQELDTLDTEQRQHIGQQISALTTGLQMLDSDTQQLVDAKNAANKVKMFTTEVQVSKSLKEYETLLAEMEKDMPKLTLTFVGNKKLYEFQTNITSLGTLKGTCKSLPYSDTSGNQCIKKVFMGKKAYLQTEVKVKAPDDEKLPSITGCTFMPSGHAVLCDYGNKNVKLLDKALVLREHLTLISSPWDVSVVDDNNVIITLTDTKQLPYTLSDTQRFPYTLSDRCTQQLQYIQVFPQFKYGRTIKLDGRCDGIEVFGDEIYTTKSYPGEVQVLDLNGNRKRMLHAGVKFDHPYYITASSSGKIFVTSGTGSQATITCMTTDGSLVRKYQNKDKLRKPLGLCVDAEDNILVCDHNSSGFDRSSWGLVVISANGKKYETLLSSSDGNKIPYSISYRETDDTLIVGFNSHDHIFVYKLV